MDFPALVGGIGQLFTIGKTIIDVRDQATATATAAEFNEAIIAIQQTAMKLQMEQQELLNRIHELEEERRKSKDVPGVVYKAPFYWKKEDENSDGPFCQACYDKDRKLVRLQKGWDQTWGCRLCTSSYHDGTPEAATPRRRFHDPYS